MRRVQNLQLEQFQNKWNSTVIIPKVSTDPYHSTCKFQPLSPEDVLEAASLLKSIAWSETPALPSPFSLNQTSDPARSTITVLPGREGGQWYVGDQLEVMIQIKDFLGHPKKSGGDLLLARLHNPKLDAGVVGQVVDHLNGSYSAVFLLPWEGQAQVQVTLAHSSEAITVLDRLTLEHYDRVHFKSNFFSGNITETTACNICLRHTEQPVCNYTDILTGEPWFCYKPKKLGCDTRINHRRVDYNMKILKATEEKLFQRGVNMKAFIPSSISITVLQKKKGEPQIKSSTVTSGPSGYYYNGVWQALGGSKVQQFTTASAISQCLKGKVIHMYGDSTVHQWYAYLVKVLPDLKEFNIPKPIIYPPFMALDYVNNIWVTCRHHGLPLSFTFIPTGELQYVANELDHVVGGANTVIAISMWAHFSAFPTEVYIWRMQSIRRAVVRLLTRAPGTVVVIRTGAPRAQSLSLALTNSDWYSLQKNKVLRAVFEGLNVHFVDAWEMVLAHRLPHNVHPKPPIVMNMMNVVLSYVCPQEAG
ncbi:NXPE family member 3-like [Pholidichthys leucotaenia]